jgi:hypothetical protein
MIHPLRQRHRRIVLVLGVFLPIAFVMGVAARKPAPTVAKLPTALTATSQQFDAVEWKRADLFAKTPIEVYLLRKQKSSGRFGIEFSAAKEFVKPDLIVYWVAGNPDMTDTLPDNAILLGSFNSATLPLPDEVAKSNGEFVLFSLANNQIMDVSQPVSLQQPGVSTH